MRSLSDRTINRLAIVGTCLTVAESAEYRPVWDGQEPAEFKTDLAALRTKYQNAMSVASQAGSAMTGAANAKAKAETALENAAIKLTRALAYHFKKTGDLTRRVKVNKTPGAIKGLRDQDLVTQATEIRNIASATKDQPGAFGCGVTPARIATLARAITPTSASSFRQRRTGHGCERRL